MTPPTELELASLPPAELRARAVDLAAEKSQRPRHELEALINLMEIKYLRDPTWWAGFLGHLG